MNIKKEDALTAYRNGCDNVKRTLKLLFPTIEFTPPLTFKVGDKVILEGVIVTVDSNDKDVPYEIRFSHDGDKIWVPQFDLKLKD